MVRSAIHPGEILADELQELNMSAAELARMLHVLYKPYHSDFKWKAGYYC